jgi:hypothetical protein
MACMSGNMLHASPLSLQRTPEIVVMSCPEAASMPAAEAYIVIRTCKNVLSVAYSTCHRNGY